VLVFAVDVAVYAIVFNSSRAVVERTDVAWQKERERLARFKTYQQAHEEVTKLAQKAIARDDLPKVVTTLESLAKRRGLKIPEVNYQPERADLQGFQKVSLSFAISGPYGHVRRFLDDLEQHSPFLAVESLTLGRAKKEESSELVVQVKVAAYLRTV
jgi:Tfp pilus assembly protein PilO